jgi:hypothetical protein
VVDTPAPLDDRPPRQGDDVARATPAPLAAADRPAAWPADPFAALADATDDVNDVAVAAGPGSAPAETPVGAGTGAEAAAGPVSSDSLESFDAVLSRIASTLGDVDDVLGRVATAAAATLGGANGSAPAAPAALAGPGHPPAPGSAPDSTPSPDEAVDEPGRPPVSGQDADTGPGDTGSADTGPAATDLGDTGPAATGPADSNLGDMGPADIASKAAMFLAGTVSGTGDATLDALRRAGLDEDTVAAVAAGLRRGGSLEALLLEAFGRLGAAPPLPRRVGSLLVVAGAGAQARELAGAAAVEMGSDPAEVAVASLDPRAEGVVPGQACVRSAEEAAELAPGWRRSRAAVVVVDAPVTDTHRSWATHVITSLRPTAVWGIVDATHKAEDIGAWAHALGGIDALAVENLGASVSPATVLRVGIPVARLDGRPASASRWTATIVDRMDPCT